MIARLLRIWRRPHLDRFIRVNDAYCRGIGGPDYDGHMRVDAQWKARDQAADGDNAMRSLWYWERRARQCDA